METYKKYLLEAAKTMDKEAVVADIVNRAYNTNIQFKEKRTTIYWKTNEDLFNNKYARKILKRFAQAYKVHPSQVTVTKNMIVLTKEE